MTVISAELVKNLRERTNAPMMECKRALEASQGNVEQAVLELRKLGRAKADKKADRIATEGMILIKADAKRAVMLEVNSETDFVARGDAFEAFSNAVVDTAWHHTAETTAQLMALPLLHQTTLTVEEARLNLVAKVGENIQVRRLITTQATTGIVGTYLHGQRIGVVVVLDHDQPVLARDIAMHIAASKPLVIAPDAVPAEALNQEKSIYAAQAATSGKPPEIIEKMVQGRLKKYIEEISLTGQPFVKDPNQTVGALLNQHHTKVLAFYRYAVGEGMDA